MTVTGVQRQVTNGLFNKVRTPRTCTVIRALAASQTAAAPVGHFPAVPTALALLRRRSSRQANALPSPAPGDPAAASSAADSGTSVDLCSTWPRPSPLRGHARPCASAREQGRPARRVGKTRRQLLGREGAAGRAWRDPAARGASCGRTVTPAAPGGPGARTAGDGHREALPRPWGWREGAASPRQALRPAGAPRGGQRCRSYFTDTTRKSSRVAPCTAASRKK